MTNYYLSHQNADTFKFNETLNELGYKEHWSISQSDFIVIVPPHNYFNQDARKLPARIQDEIILANNYKIPIYLAYHANRGPNVYRTEIDENIVRAIAGSYLKENNFLKSNNSNINLILV